ncbi:unnamed protein product [Cuscuta campestris]|uniref:Uncharacterized protein n=1 Tax=Cuscuta campestris TaxID=132261 RepID=A0A484LJ98_9ASTE|nr:unnamed protein product [Cuscuta campestris]
MGKRGRPPKADRKSMGDAVASLSAGKEQQSTIPSATTSCTKGSDTEKVTSPETDRKEESVVTPILPETDPIQNKALESDIKLRKNYVEAVGIQDDLNLDLRFIQAEMIDGQPIARLTQEDVNEPRNYWNSAPICCILGANPPLEVIKEFLSDLVIWKSYESDGISFLKESQFTEWKNLSLPAPCLCSSLS